MAQLREWEAYYPRKKSPSNEEEKGILPGAAASVSAAAGIQAEASGQSSAAADSEPESEMTAAEATETNQQRLSETENTAFDPQTTPSDDTEGNESQDMDESEAAENEPKGLTEAEAAENESQGLTEAEAAEDEPQGLIAAEADREEAEASEKTAEYAKQESAIDPDWMMPEKEDGVRGMYFFDFLAHMFRGGNGSAIVYMVITICIISVICMGSFLLPVGWAFLCGGVIYIAALIIALSPIGEAMLRKRCRCKVIDDREIATRMAPILKETIEKARQEDPAISPDIRLYMNEDESENVFATGRRTICMTRGLSKMPDDMIRGLLAHEIGHISRRDTDRILAAVTANSIAAFLMFVLWTLMLVFKTPAVFMQNIGISQGGPVYWGMIGISIAVYFVVFLILSRIWTLPGVLMFVRANREKEYETDRFVAKLRLDGGLKRALEYQLLGEGPRPRRLFARFAKAHLPIRDRIRRLERAAGRS